MFIRQERLFYREHTPITWQPWCDSVTHSHIIYRSVWCWYTNYISTLWCLYTKHMSRLWFRYTKHMSTLWCRYTKRTTNRVVRGQWIVKDVKGSGFYVTCGNILEGLGKTMKKIYQDRHCSGLDSNPKPSEYNSELACYSPCLRLFSVRKILI